MTVIQVTDNKIPESKAKGWEALCKCPTCGELVTVTEDQVDEIASCSDGHKFKVVD